MKSWRVMVNLLCVIGLFFPLLVQPTLNWRVAVFAQSDDKEPNPMVTWYAKTYGVSYEEAERRLLLQAEMSGLEQKVIAGEPTYAGSWMEHTPEFRLVVAFASPDGQTIIQKYLEGIAWANLVHVQQSPYTATELLHISEQVNTAAQATGIPFTSGVSYQRSKVVFYTPSPDELRSQLEANPSIQAYLGDTEYVYEASMSVPLTPQEEKNPMVLWYAETFNLSYEEAEYRLNVQREMDELETKIIEGEATYAGSSTQHQPEFGLVVAFAASNGEEIIRKYLEGIEWANLVKVQSAKFTASELVNVLDKVNKAAVATNLPFESGTDFQTGKVILWTPNPDELRSQLEIQESIQQYVDDIDYIYRESLSVPMLTYPYLLGGHPIDCTTAYVLTRNSDGKRFISTSGHCANTQNVIYNGVASVYLGPVEFENDPYNDPPGSNNFLDLQTHNVSVRSFDLTNMIRVNATVTATVVSRELKATTLGDSVCKYGKVTGLTCGFVTEIYYSPSYAPGGRFVRVDNSSMSGDISCPGDSGSPVFKLFGNASAMGLLSGGPPPTACDGSHKYYFYSPVDEIEARGFSILTTHYQQRYHLNVWSGANCTQYVTPVDANGSLVLTQQTTQACGTSLPANSSGTVQSYNAYVVGDQWREGMWRGGVGYLRKVPLNNNGTVNWGAAPAWSVCCSGQTAPLAQEGKVVGNYIYLNVFEAGGGCTEYKAPLNDTNGDPNWAAQTTGACRTSAPGSGAVQSYNSYVVAQIWREGIWRNSSGYVRGIYLNNTNADINYGSAPAWTSCCGGITPPDSQGGDILTYP